MMIGSRSLQCVAVSLLPFNFFTEDDFGKLQELLVVTSGKVLSVVWLQESSDEGKEIFFLSLIRGRNFREDDVCQVQRVPGGFQDLEEGNFWRLCIAKQFCKGCSNYELEDVVSTG